jgi:alpha-tubulin suppressor-like RCC1 family protein
VFIKEDIKMEKFLCQLTNIKKEGGNYGNPKKQIPIPEHSGPRSAIMRRTVSVLLAMVVLGALIIFNPFRFFRGPVDRIPIQGLEAPPFYQGVAAWNTIFQGFESGGTGHSVTGISCGPSSVAYYYLASRDGGVYNIDSDSTEGIQGLLGMTGFKRFALALAADGRSTEDLTMSWGLQSLGNDVEYQNWWIDGSVETRFYSGGEFTIKLGGEDLVGGPMPRTILTIDHNDPADCSDDRLFGSTDPVTPQDYSGNSGTAVQSIAAAFLNDLGNEGIRFIFDSYQPALQEPEFEGNGRTGAFFEIQSGRIETAELSVPVAWGSNSFGQLGVGTNTVESSPVLVESLRDVAAVAAGGVSSLALKNDGTVWWWGWNSTLGMGASSPVQVSGLTDVVAIAAGWSHFLALDSNGAVWAWGRNNQGQLGDGCTIGVDCTKSMTPAQVGSLSNVVAIAAGGDHSLALKGDGTVWAWGSNWNGQLGDNTTVSHSTPVQVRHPDFYYGAEPLTGVVAIAVGGGSWVEPHSLALKKDGTVLAWGANGSGQLGDGSNTPSLVPVPVVDPSNTTLPLTGVIGIAAGGGDIGGIGFAHSLALKDDGTVWAWGANRLGQLGDGTTTDSSIPVQVSGLPVGVAALAAGNEYSLALRPDGTVWAWGSNYGGELGDPANTGNFSSTAIPVSGLTVGVVAIAAGFGHNLVIGVPPW